MILHRALGTKEKRTRRRKRSRTHSLIDEALSNGEDDDGEDRMVLCDCLASGWGGCVLWPLLYMTGMVVAAASAAQQRAQGKRHCSVILR